MVDRKKVRTQLAEIGIGLDMAGYHNDAQCVRDALALLREQEPAKRHPRVMTLEEVQDALDTVVWLDDGGENTSGNYALVESYSGTMTAVWFKLMDRDAGQQRRHYESYGKRWRCWDIRPTDEQRRAVKWDD